MEDLVRDTGKDFEEKQATQEEVIDYKSLYEKSQADLQAVAKKKEELLSETKKAKDEQRHATETARQASEAKAAKDGEFEKLWQTTKSEKDALLKQLQDITTSNRREKLQVAAMRIATELADGDNAELLSDFVARNLDKMADETGNTTSDVLEAIKNDFKTNAKFKALLRGSKAAGGGATGNMSSAQQSNTVDRATFDKMSPGKKMDLMKSGGSVVDSL